jgi:hypothetical protein
MNVKHVDPGAVHFGLLIVHDRKVWKVARYIHQPGNLRVRVREQYNLEGEGPLEWLDLGAPEHLVALVPA